MSPTRLAKARKKRSSRKNRLLKYSKILLSIPELSKCQIQSLVQNGSNDFIRCLSECVGNILHGNVSLSAHHKKKLKKHKKILRFIGTSSVPVHKRKRLLIQHGSGFLPLLIPGLAALIRSMFGKSA